MTKPARTELRTSPTGHAVTVGWFDHPADMTAWIVGRRGEEPVRRQLSFADRHWLGADLGDVLRRGVAGDESRVRDAEALVEQLQVAVPAPRSEWVPSRHGAYPIVADALAGHPESMRRKVYMPSDRSPLRLFLDVASSASVGHETMSRHGTALLALAMLLANERPVEVHAFSLQSMAAGRAGLAVCRIPSAPLDLAVACNALSSPGFARAIMYSATNCLAGRWLSGDWLGLFGRPAEYVAAARALLGAEPQDVVIGPTFAGDPIAADPVAFVRRSVEEHLGQLED